MARPVKLLLVCTGLLAVASAVSACASFGTESIKVPKSQGAAYQGAVLFNQRCSGCHTLSYAATHGSAANVRTAQYNNGPNFDQRCERPITRVLYAIENGGFSGAVMPQNVVVGQQAQEVATFVATYSGRKAPKVPGVPSCQQKAIGAIPTASTATATTGPTGTTAAATAPKKSAAKKAVAKRAKSKHKP